MSLTSFDEERASSYDGRIRRLAPGYDILHEQIVSLLVAHLDSKAHLLVVGAGTGAEIVRLGKAASGWRFTAVDPSAEMLDRCRANVGDAGLEGRVEYVHGRVEDLSSAPLFDAATSVFVAHFIQDAVERRAFFQGVADLLRAGALFVLADLFKSDDATERLLATWRAHYGRTGSSADDAEQTFARIRRDIYFATEPELEQTLTQVGFAPPLRFYQSFLWGGWITERQRTSPEAT